MDRLKHFRDLIVEAAVCQLAVDEFEPEPGEDADIALAHLKKELEVVKLSLLAFILQEGEEVRAKILSGALMDDQDDPKAANEREGLWRTPFNR